MLRLPGDFKDLRGNTFVSLTQLFPDTRQVSIAPGRFDHDASQVRVAGLSNAPLSNTLTTGVFTRKCSAIPHQLPGALETRGDVAQFGGDRDCRDVRDAP